MKFILIQIKHELLTSSLRKEDDKEKVSNMRQSQLEESMKHKEILKDVTIPTKLLLEFSNSPNIQAVRLPLKFKYILTIPHICDQLRQTVKAP